MPWCIFLVKSISFTLFYPTQNSAPIRNKDVSWIFHRFSIDFPRRNLLTNSQPGKMEKGFCFLISREVSLDPIRTAFN